MNSLANPIRLRFMVFISTVLLTSISLQAEAPHPKPNVVVILTDDQGYADISCQGILNDVKTPHIDSLAAMGVRCTAGYVTAPQCSPSRAGLISGRNQQRFGLDTIPDNPMPLTEQTIPKRLKKAGYISGMVGKWHLDPNLLCLKWAKQEIPDVPVVNGQFKVPLSAKVKYSSLAQGFDECFQGELNGYFATHNAEGKALDPHGKFVTVDGYRIDIQTQAALSFIKRNSKKPFFLYLAYYGPHVPLDAPKNYLDRFPGEMSERRRYGLAMISAIDDGVGKILETLKAEGILNQTLICYASDNGAPLDRGMPDKKPVSGNGWDGSRNDPLIGEKGILAEGGIRVPYILSCPNLIPQGQVYDQLVSTLDIAATAVSIAGLPVDDELDGVNLIPFLTKNSGGVPHEALYWRFWNQSAIRMGEWKYIKPGDRPGLLFDLSSKEKEGKNLIEKFPEIAKKLSAKLEDQLKLFQPPGYPKKSLNDAEVLNYKFYKLISD